VPVLAQFSAGPAVFAGPTAGYLFGFLIAGYVAGTFADKGYGRSHVSAFLVALLAAAIIFAAGVPVLSLFVGWDQAVKLGLLPFIVTEPIKLLAVSAVIPRLWRN
jgi:biotin transporter BioY